MTNRFALSWILVLWLASTATATTYYADNLNACTGNYNTSTRACDGSDGNSYTTFSAAVAPLAPGDTLIVRQFSGGAGVWNDRINLQDAGKSGTAGNYITIAGYPGESVIIRYTDTVSGGYGGIKARGNRGYFIFQDLKIDGVNHANNAGWAIRDGNHHFILRRIEIYNQFYHGVYVSASDVTIEDSLIHDARSDCVPNNRMLGLYLHDGSNITVRRTEMYNLPGGGVQVYPGPLSTVPIQNNNIHNVDYCSTSIVGGIVVEGGSGGGSITGVEISGNTISYINQNLSGTINGIGAGIKVAGSATNQATGTKLHNNTIYKVNNHPTIGNNEYCILIASGAVNTDLRNNVATDCGGAGGTVNYFNGGTGTTVSHTACLASENCPATNKVTIASAAAVFVDPANRDFRLKQGADVLRDAGTSVSTRPAPVGVTDIGAYEQGAVTSASVVSGFIELVFSVMTPGIIPATNISGVTITCVGCTGTPVAAVTNTKSGANNLVQVTVSGITSNGTCTVSLGATNATDSLFVGGPTGTAQGINSVTGLAVSGSCQNTVTGGGGGGGGLYSYFPLNEGAGTVANDASGLSHHGTVSAGVTWVTGTAGTGVSIPTDATFRHVEAPYGSGVDPTAQGFGVCARVKLSSLAAQKVLVSAGGNGASQRWYIGLALIGGQPQWGIGIQNSSFVTGSEFVATGNTTFICLVNDAVADTATLWVDGVKGIQVGKSIKSFTSFTLVGNIRAGNDGTFSVNNGGFTLYELWTWNAKPADSDITTLYASFTPTGTTACLALTHRQFENPYLTSANAVVVATPKADGSLAVVANGTFAVKIQYTCTGTAGTAVSTRLTYSLDGTNFFLTVPQGLGVDGVSMSGPINDARANVGTSLGCVDATGLTPNSGVTMVDATASPTFTLAQNHCRSDRYIIHVGNIPGQSRWFRVQTDAGDLFANGYSQAIKVDIITPQATGGVR